MAIRADELALSDLFEDRPIAMLRYERSHIGHLLKAWQVIPVHRSRVEGRTAVSTWRTSLKVAVPTDEVFVTASSLAPAL